VLTLDGVDERRRGRPWSIFVSYGHDPAIGDGPVVGEHLQPRTPIHLIDDLV
jgi:hypothetical protein